jgi:hypothetical protein
MPFDVAGFVTPTSLDDYLKRIGVRPIPMAELQAHKQEQLRLHPPSLFVTKKPYITSALLGFGGFVALDTMAGLGGTTYGVVTTALIMGLMSLFTCFMLTSLVLGVRGTRLLGRATWIEQASPRNLDLMIPEPIRDVVQRVRRTMPANALLLTGELVQNETVLDPYVVLHLNGEHACLGIWLNQEVIACAEMT